MVQLSNSARAALAIHGTARRSSSRIAWLSGGRRRCPSVRGDTATNSHLVVEREGKKMSESSKLGALNRKNMKNATHARVTGGERAGARRGSRAETAGTARRVGALTFSGGFLGHLCSRRRRRRRRLCVREGMPSPPATSSRRPDPGVYLQGSGENGEPSRMSTSTSTQVCSFVVVIMG